MGELEGKVIMVTGASRGIGLAIARRLAEEGAHLVMVARQREALDRAKAQVAGGPLLVSGDVTRSPDVIRMFRRVGRQFGRLDVLVNNAGVFTYKPFANTTLKDWRANLETNLTSLFLVTQAALPWLAKSQAAHLVNILSVSSRLAFPNCSAYTASKLGALGLTRVLAEELRPQKIRVTAILPGSTNTRLCDEFGFAVRRAELIQPEDVAEAVVSALLQPPRTTVEEIWLSPSRGAL
jgi:NAD(P)-dependent dehydrogenase (short-subunit alcohol dehydrogenase family)